MYKVITNEVAGNRFTEMLASPRARKCVTFIGHFDSFEEKMKHLREAELFFDQYAIADHKLKGMPTLLLNDDGYKGNKVLVFSPASVWVEVTNASAEELSEISMGIVEGHESPATAGLGLTNIAFGLTLGVSLHQ